MRYDDTSFEETILALHGANGAEWLDRLPAIVRECADVWSLDVGSRFASACHSFVAPAESADGSAVVLKLFVHADHDYHAQKEALDAFAGVGAARLLDSNVDRAALLLERVVPGRPLSELVEAGRGDLATLPAMQVMVQLWRRVPGNGYLRNTSDEARQAFADLRMRNSGHTAPLPATHVEHAEQLLETLTASAPEPVVLHGDLHYANILQSDERGWLAIDPKGRVGEPACEVASLLRTPLAYLVSHPDRRTLLARRVRQFSTFLALDPARAVGWGIVLAVAAGCWELEDHGSDWEPWFIVADTLAEIAHEEYE